MDRSKSIVAEVNKTEPTRSTKVQVLNTVGLYAKEISKYKSSG